MENADLPRCSEYRITSVHSIWKFSKMFHLKQIWSKLFHLKHFFKYSAETKYFLNETFFGDFHTLCRSSCTSTFEMYVIRTHKGLFKCSAPAAYFSIRSTSRNTNKVTNRKYPSFLLYIQWWMYPQMYSRCSLWYESLKPRPCYITNNRIKDQRGDLCFILRKWLSP